MVWRWPPLAQYGGQQAFRFRMEVAYLHAPLVRFAKPLRLANLAARSG